MKHKILSIGAVYLDINCGHFPHGGVLLPEKEVVGGPYELVPGGSAFNFARMCVALELPPVFVGKVGADTAGKLLTELIDTTGVTSALIQSAEVVTNIGMNFSHEKDGSILTVVGSANQSLSAQEIEIKVGEHVNEIQFLYLGGGFKLRALLPSYHVLCQKAHDSGVKVVLDHGRVTNTVSADDGEAIRKIIPLVDYYLPSKEEFMALWQAETIEEAVKKVREVSDALIVVKDAENGMMAFEGSNEALRVPAFKVDVIHSVGAGDSFNAGFIKAQDMGMSLEQSLRFAGATAALKISRKHTPHIEDIQNLLNQR